MMLFKPFFGFLKRPALTLIEKIALNPSNIFILKLANNRLNTLFLTQNNSSEAVFLKILWAKMTATNTLLSLFPRQTRPDPLGKQTPVLIYDGKQKMNSTL